jgi:hypothetical protein
LIEKAARLWGKAGQQSLERSALIEAMEQLTRALDLTAKLPSTPVVRREEIKLQAALLTPLLNIKVYPAPETKAAVKRARLLIEQAEARSATPPKINCCCSQFFMFSGPQTAWLSIATSVGSLQPIFLHLLRSRGQVRQL